MDVSATQTEPQVLETLDIARILELLPHRYPFLMIDRIVDILGDESCIGIKNVTFNEPFFIGHFPERPIMPGVLLVEGMAQTAGAVCILRTGSDKPKLVYFMTIDKCKFRRPVVPGDVVRYHVTKIRNRRTIWKYAAVARVDGNVVAEAEISAMIADR
jgi:3-hydroxyacyl-[acyl-carrier-protein] dehydratase